MHGNTIDQRARQHGNDTEHQHQAQLEPGAENLGLVVTPQGAQLPANEPDHAKGQHDVEPDKQRIVAGKQHGIGCRRHEQQEPQDAADGCRERPACRDDALHLTSAGRAAGASVADHVFQSEARLQSLLPSAEIWNGRGSWVTSSRMRSDAA